MNVRCCCCCTENRMDSRCCEFVSNVVVILFFGAVLAGNAGVPDQKSAKSVCMVSVSRQ